MKVPVKSLSSGTPSGLVDSKLTSRSHFDEDYQEKIVSFDLVTLEHTQLLPFLSDQHTRGDGKETSLSENARVSGGGAAYRSSVASDDEESSSDEDDEDSSKPSSDETISSDEGEDLAQGLSPSEDSSDDETDISGEPVIERYIQPPRWSQTRPDFVHFNTVEEYETLAVGVELAVQKLLAEHPYNTVGNLLRFYKGYKSSGEPMTSYFKKLNATLTRGQHTCVGLGLILMSRLQSLYPSMAGKFFIASSEEAIEEIPEYLDRPPWDPHDVTEKEHVLVACRIKVGKREGVFLLDPGYHVPRVVTVMKDSSYPNTSWFRIADESWVKRDYCYRFPEATSDYVLWEAKETRPNKTPVSCINAVYVGAHYFSAVAVTEKRNLVYIYRSLLSRNTKGEVSSGVHFPVDHLSNNPSVNLIYANASGVKTRGRIPFKSFLCQELAKEDREMLHLVEDSLGGGYGLVDILSQTSELLADRPFVDALRLINCSINIVGTS